ncbi:hypothetical protein R5R35_001161 [Gryllus longicercus]|uniref:CHK kinase-like domain-containing protein n=1 Tax=Gryllus longicercus TaxID=2509291 RepID=A0AAN9Z9J7_9ORTH
MSNPDKSEDHHGDVATPPSWLDTQLIRQALRNGGEHNPVVASISVRHAVAPGENYISTVYRVMATLSDGRQRHFIIKGPAMGGLSEMAKGTCVFQREIDMFTDYIPKMEALLEAAAPGRFPPLAPRCYHYGTSPVEFLVMEDLAPSGFKLADRKRGLGLRHSLLALRTLARFHAASYALLKRQPELTEQLDNILKSDNQAMVDYVNGELQATAIACRSWPGFEEIADRLEKFKSVSGIVFDEVNKPTPGAFNVITHGDFWVNNMMYRYEDGHPMELKLVDLQLSHVSSPAIDVLHVFSNSLSEDVDEHHQPFLLREYHFELKTTLELLGHEAPSPAWLERSLDAHGAYAVFTALETPLVKAERGVDVAALSGGDCAPLLRLLRAQPLRRRMQRKLKDYARRGRLPA